MACCGDWRHLDWKTEKPRGIAFYCDCCNNHNYYDGQFKAGYDGWHTLKAILCFECYNYIGSNCEHCNPPEENNSSDEDNS